MKYRITQQTLSPGRYTRRRKWIPCHYKGEFLWLASAAGYAELVRYERTPHSVSMAFIEWIQGGKHYIKMVQPCPTRAGLVRMACREIRKIVGDAPK